MSRIFVLEDREVIEKQITVEGKLSKYEPFTKEDIFISNRYETPFECRIDNLEIPRESLVIVQDKVNFSLEQVKKYKEYDYDFFMGGVAKYDIDVMEKYMYMLIDITNFLYVFKFIKIKIFNFFNEFRRILNIR